MTACRTLPVLIVIVTSVLVCSVAADQKSHASGLIDLVTIPGAPELGWVEGMRHSDANGLAWHCKLAPGPHLYSLERLREGRARLPADVAKKGFQTIFNYEAQHGGFPAVERGQWERALRIYLIQHLTFLSEHGRAEFRMPKPSLTWRGWLRQALEDINQKAYRKGLSAAHTRQALINWVMCHISDVQAEQVRQKIYDVNEADSKQ